MNELQGWRRRAVIRGDALSVGLWAWLAAGLMVGCLVWPDRLNQAGLSPAVAGVMAGLLMAVGAISIRWHRTQYRRLLDAVRVRFHDHDPGDAPVSWVSDEVWRQRNRFDPDLDPINELRAEVEPLTAGFSTESRIGAVTLPELRVVTDDEREAAPKDVGDWPETPRGELAHVASTIEQTPGRFIVSQPLWPVCCGAAAQLLSLADDGMATAAFYLRPNRDEGLAPFAEPSVDPEGAHTYRCSVCGGLFAAHSLW